jgi:hypothetical protein
MSGSNATGGGTGPWMHRLAEGTMTPEAEGHCDGPLLSGRGRRTLRRVGWAVLPAPGSGPGRSGGRQGFGRLRRAVRAALPA